MDKAMSDALSDLAGAQLAFVEAEKIESAARSQRCDALNRLNGAQKAVDAAYAAIKKSSPYESDWKTSTQPRGESA